MTEIKSLLCNKDLKPDLLWLKENKEYDIKKNSLWNTFYTCCTVSGEAHCQCIM